MASEDVVEQAAQVMEGQGHGRIMALFLAKCLERAGLLRARPQGCTCHGHTDVGAVYAEDVTCPAHGSVSRDELDRLLRGGDRSGE